MEVQKWFWSCFAASCTSGLDFLNNIMNCDHYQKYLGHNKIVPCIKNGVSSRGHGSSNRSYGRCHCLINIGKKYTKKTGLLNLYLFMTQGQPCSTFSKGLSCLVYTRKRVGFYTCQFKVSKATNPGVN